MKKEILIKAFVRALVGFVVMSLIGCWPLIRQAFAGQAPPAQEWIKEMLHPTTFVVMAYLFVMTLIRANRAAASRVTP